MPRAAGFTRFTLGRVTAAVLLCGALPTAMAAEAADLASAGFTRQLARLINEYRAQHGLSPLQVADELASIAGEHSSRMAHVRQLSHDGFRGRLQQTRSALCVENVGWNHRTPEALLEGWRQSPAHHRNLLEPGVSRMGLATATRYVTFFACR